MQTAFGKFGKFVQDILYVIMMIHEFNHIRIKFRYKSDKIRKIEKLVFSLRYLRRKNFDALSYICENWVSQKEADFRWVYLKKGVNSSSGPKKVQRVRQRSDH